MLSRKPRCFMSKFLNFFSVWRTCGSLFGWIISLFFYFFYLADGKSQIVTLNKKNTILNIPSLFLKSGSLKYKIFNNSKHFCLDHSEFDRIVAPWRQTFQVVQVMANSNFIFSKFSINLCMSSKTSSVTFSILVSI